MSMLFALKPQKDLAKKGVDTSKPYDTRDVMAIRKWVEEVAAKAR